MKINSRRVGTRFSKEARERKEDFRHAARLAQSLGQTYNKSPWMKGQGKKK